MGRAPAAALPSDASIEEPASKRPTNSSSSGGKGGQGGKGGRGSKGGKGAAAKGAQTNAKGAKAKGGGYKDGERKGKRERAGERSKGEHAKGGKRGKGGKEHAVAWSAPSTADMSRGGLGLGLGFERRPRRVVTKESLLVWLAIRAAA